MVQWLKQSTAYTFRLGPFVDDGDGKTAETSLTLSQADFRLSKAGAANAQKNDATAGTHDENGWYSCVLNATDTNTLGPLTISVHESGALPVWKDFMVVAANVYDSLVGGTDYLQTDVAEWKGSTAPAMTGDAFARLGAPAGASVSADVAAVKAVLPAALVSGRIDASVGAMANDVMTAAAAASDLTTELQSGLATAASIAALHNLSAAEVNAEVDAALADAGVTTTVTGRIDAAVSTRLASGSYTAPDNSGIAAIGVLASSINDKTANLPADPADQSEVEDAIAAAVYPLATAAALAAVGDTANAIAATAAKLDDTLEDAGGWRFTEDALAQAPAGGGGGGGESAEDIAAAVVDQTLSGHSASGTVGGALAKIGVGLIATSSPVTQAGAVETWRGDDYDAADGRALEWTDAASLWPDLTGGTVAVHVLDQTYAGAVVTPTGDDKKLRLELTAAQTAALRAGRWSYRVAVTVGGDTFTLVAGVWTSRA